MSRNKPTEPIDVKSKMLQNGSFCMLPWIHVYTTPEGIAAPCCIANSCTTQFGVGDATIDSMMEIVNSKDMKQLRKDMMKGVKNPECANCHKYEEQGVNSPRQQYNSEYSKYFDEVLASTKKTGELKEFKMRYFDVRFSNICNFKCRTCGPQFSSQWEQEYLKIYPLDAKVYPKNDSKEFLAEVVDQIDNIQTAYFAGGEPLITEEHYIMLEEMIKRGRTDISLRYNTNLSNLKFKDKDLLSLWKHFKNGVSIYASIDHYGDRAEYIRHGTDWAKVEENFIMARKTPYISLQMNSVLSVFNYLTFNDFYQYLIDKNLYSPKDRTYTVYAMATPVWYSCHILPPEMKKDGQEKMEKLISIMQNMKFKVDSINQVTNAMQWVSAEDTWDDNKLQFRHEIARIDNLRGEDFEKTFPELKTLLAKYERKKLWPV